MNESLEELTSHRHSIAGLIPFLDAVRSIAEIAWRRAEQRAAPLAAYYRQLESVLEQALANVGDDQRAKLLYWPGRTGGKPITGILLITSERGLCGSFNERLVARGLECATELRARGDQGRILCLGAQGRRRLEAAGETLLYSSPLPSLSIPTYPEIERIALDLLDLAEGGAFTRLLVVHHAPTQRFQYESSVQTLLPPDLKTVRRQSRRSLVKPGNDGPALLTQVLTEYFLLGLYRVILDSALSEQLARVFTMRLATDNARNLLDQLNQDYNLASRYAITNALLETLTGYEATIDR